MTRIPLPYAQMIFPHHKQWLRKIADEKGITTQAFLHLLATQQKNHLEDACTLAAHLSISHQYIHQDPHICSGDPVLRGTRIRAKDIGGLFLKHPQEVRDGYPHLTQSQLESAALYYLLTLPTQQP